MAVEVDFAGAFAGVDGIVEAPAVFGLGGDRAVDLAPEAVPLAEALALPGLGAMAEVPTSCSELSSVFEPQLTTREL